MITLGKKLGLAALLTMGTMSFASAGVVVLDTFDYDTQISLTDTTPNSGTELDVRYDVNSFYGDVTYELNLNENGLQATANTFNAGSGLLAWGNIGSSTSSLSLTYTELFNGSQNSGGNLDLTGGGSEDAFYFDVDFSDAGFDVSVIVGSGSGVSTANFVSTAINSLTRTTLAFDSFVGTATFSDVTFAKVIISSSSQAADLTLVEFGTIPEPSTVAIFGLALVGFALSSRKKLK